ncbi:MAG: hypothetical protein V4795_16990 [Pseudomonadota bacterium]
MTPPQQQLLIDAIQAYLARHPQAADSADGVARWWLVHGAAAPTRLQVEQALATMVRAGLLRRVDLPDGTVLFSCEAAPRH